MKKTISKPEIKVIRFKPRDIITASGTNGSGKRPPGWDKNPNNPHHAPGIFGAEYYETI